MAARGDEKKRKRPQKQKPGNIPLPRKPFKISKKEPLPISAASVTPASLLVQDADPDFPRGGRNLLSREEKAEARAEAEAEFEKEERDAKRAKGRGKGKRKVGRKSSGEAEDELGSLFGEGSSGNLPRYANRITLKNISSRMKLWGVIVEVNPKDLVISLPGGLRGFVRAEEVFDVLLDNEYKVVELDYDAKIFHVGQLVSTVVLQVDDDRRDKKGNKRIWLSLRLSLLYKGLTLDAVQDGMVLIAQVKSIEDHGYILHFGVPSFTGFLPRSCLGGAEAIIGQLIQGVVKSIDKARAVVHLNSDSNMVTKSVTKDLKGLSIDQLVPGTMVNARVVSTLANGIMLSFLTYFTGTVDTFHLQESFPSATWKDLYKKNKKVNARILFIDPATRAVGLTLNPHLVLNKHPPSNIKIGDIYDNSRIVRIDRGAGLLVEIPSSPTASPAYVNIIDAADEEVPKLEKKFTEGGQVRVRVLGLRHLEGLPMGSLKASAFEGSVFTHSDVKPGMLVKAKVIAVENFGAIVQFASGVKALCPLPHMSEFDMVKTDRKFKVGAELLFRVLGCKSKRITVTHKKTLVKSKLVVLASYADATVGLVTHGWITKIEKHGCFVRFYNGVQGFTHRSELGLDPGSEPDEIHHIGQVMKCRVISSTPAARKINLSFVISPKRASADDVCQVGSLVSGVVERLTSAAVVIHLKEYGYLKGTIANEHLADHQGQAASLKSLLRPGHEFDRLLILDKEGNNLILSAKYSLVNSAQDIPLDITQVHPSSVVHGYVCNLIETGCFVRFLGRLTGFSPKNKATDEQIDNLSEAFYPGQSVRSHVLSVERETGRMKLSLKQSTCFSMDVSFIRGYFSVEEKIASLQTLDMKNSKPKWIADFKVGTVVEGEIQEIKEFGVILSFKDYPDVVGFIVQHQCGVNVKVGSVVRAFVLDVVMSDGLIDLSLKSELVDSVTSPYKKKRRVVDTITLGLNDTVTALVEIVKENYLVLSIPDHNYAIGYAFAFDYNTQKLPSMHFVNGQRVSVTIGALASDDSSGRLLLLVKSLHVASDTSSSKRLKKSSNYNIGSLVEGEIINIKPLELILKFGNGSHGRLHITEVDDDHFVDHPLSKFRIGEMLKAQIVAKPHPSGKSGKARQWELSVRPSLFSGTTGGTQTQTDEIQKYSSGDIVRGYVVRVDSEWAWLTISRHIMAHLFILDSSLEPNELEEFQKRFRVGEAVEASILSVNEKKKILRIKLCGLLSHGEVLNYQSSDGGKENKVSNIHGAEHIQQGDIVSGRIRKVLPGIGGLHVQIGPHLYGRVHYTELTDTWVPHPLSGYQEGQFIKCKVLEINPSSEGFMHVDLSLRASLLGIQSSSPANGVHKDTCNKRFETFDDLQPTMDVQGYVKNVTAKGCFIMLSRRIDARILLSNLSDGYVEDPEKEFPSGKLVCGKVLSVDISSKRVDVTLKSDFSRQRSKDDAVAFDNVHVGDIINGQIRRIESYGLFITIENTSLVGLCHISEISDDHVDNIHDTVHNAGDKVVVKILKVDHEKQRISLGMKKSYFANGSDMDLHPIHTNNEEAANDPNYLDLHENGGPSFLGPPLSRASVLPLQVSLDDCENSAGEDVEATRENAASTDVNGKNNQRRMRKKAKEERELEISAAEERFLQMDSPETVDEFEKLVRSSPNSSFVWIKYMAFMLSLADVEKAREIAERALRTINIRDEGEKLNVWVAYFNLENEYGSPPEEAVKKTFQRALQYSDPKKLHFALLGMYERTKQQKLASELLERMTKKFKNSRKVWINHIHCLLKQGKDEIQSIINRALLSLPRHKHIKFLSQTAILEFKCGVPDRGRTMFEGILREYPKKMDLWSIYLDQEIRMQDPEVIRALFERATCLSLPPKKMKFLFKKYLDYEKTHGDDKRIEHVKRKALEYVENLTA